MTYPLYGYGSVPWIPSDWKAIDDRVRGGSSTSFMSYPKEDEEKSGRSIRFHGHLDIKTLGGAGFASQSTVNSPDALPSNRYSGIQFTLLPNLHTATSITEFVLILKTDQPETRPDGRIQSRISYEYHFSSPPSPLPKTLTANWQDFEPTYRGRPVPRDEAKPLDPADLTELSWMCRSDFGAQFGDFELIIGQVCAVERPRTGAWEWAKSWLKWIFRSSWFGL